MREKIYVHVADDHKILIDGIIAIINTDDDIEVEGYSLTGKEVVHWRKENKADVLILDINMPEASGFEVLKYFKKKKIKQKVIVLSSHDEPGIVEEIVKDGANGYVTKSNAGEHIIDAIKVVANGGHYISGDVQKNITDFRLGQQIEKGYIPPGVLKEKLTEREIELLKLICKEYNTIQIAEALNLSIHTVKSYRKILYTKTNVKNAVGLVMFAIKYKIT